MNSESKIGILKGGFIFLSDLVRSIRIPVEIDFLAISSYGSGTTSSGVVKIRKDIDIDISGRDVIVVEDIVDSGLSLQYATICCNIIRQVCAPVCCWTSQLLIRWMFLLNMWDEQYRNLPYIGILKESLYK